MGAKARKKILQLETEISLATPAVFVGDQGRLGQILLNLIDNAIKFTEKGEVRVAVRPCGDHVEFSVSDTGIGVPDKNGDDIPALQPGR